MNTTILIKLLEAAAGLRGKMDGRTLPSLDVSKLLIPLSGGILDFVRQMLVWKLDKRRNCPSSYFIDEVYTD